MGEEFSIKGVCTCKNDNWKWKIEGNTLKLTCTKCGKVAEFGVPYPMLDMTLQAVDK